MLSLYRSTAGVAASIALLTACAGQGGGSAIPLVPPAKSGAARASALLYVSDTVTGDVYVFSYPKGKLVQTLTGFTDPAGECVDAAGNVFIANTGSSNVLEYAHGGSSPIATLNDAGYFPVGCAIDPVSGNLAVSNFPESSSANGDVVIYKHAKGRPTGHYTSSTMNQMLLCGYDGSGNLFVDGLGQASAFEFAELPKGGSKLVSIALNQAIQSAGGVQWDGSHIAVGDQSTNTIYQFAISGKRGTLAGSTALGGASVVFQFWIDGSRVVGPDSGLSDVGIWRYPGGGSALKTITGLYAPLGATVSRGMDSSRRQS